jgi:hypothetical protein
MNKDKLHRLTIELFDLYKHEEFSRRVYWNVHPLFTSVPGGVITTPDSIRDGLRLIKII